MKVHNESLQDEPRPVLEPESRSESRIQPAYAVCETEPKPAQQTEYGLCHKCCAPGVYTLTRWAIRHKPTGNFIPDSLGKYTQSEPTPNCIPRLFDTRQGAVSSLNRWLEGVWRLSYYRVGGYETEWDYDWGPEPPPKPRIKSEMEVVEVEIQIQVVSR